MPDETVTAVHRASQGKRVEMSTRLHTWVGDGKQSEDLPDPAGPNPFVHLLGALASCMALTARFYADRKGWALDAVHLEISDDRGEGQPLESVRVGVRIEGDLDQTQRMRIFEILRRCPVHRTLAPSVDIQSTLVT